MFHLDEIFHMFCLCVSACVYVEFEDSESREATRIEVYHFIICLCVQVPSVCSCGEIFVACTPQGTTPPQQRR